MVSLGVIPSLIFCLSSASFFFSPWPVGAWAAVGRGAGQPLLLRGDLGHGARLEAAPHLAPGTFGICF